ncbi:MAG: efflux RND transporter periplasmic adaptor subunit [Blautia sp.]|nr:efflux RND transporter periplasmic adaptor subunit [Blautia sp.]MDY5030616.1 efflux RND transporter periplasmic adaptor subunit [Blautia sp.]
MKKRGFVILGLLLAVTAAGGGGWYYYTKVKPQSDDNIVYVTAVSTLNGAAAGVENRYAGVVEPQETVEVKLDSGRTVKEVQVKVGDTVKQGQLLFEYDLSSIQEDLAEAKLALDRLKNEALSLADQITTLEKEKTKASADNQLSYTIEIETNKMNLKKNEYDQKSKEAEIEKLQNATGNTEVRSEIDGIIQKIDNSKLSNEDGDSLEDSGDSFLSDSSNSDSGAFITILSTGAYRIKGQVNELNISSIVTGDPVIIRSRVDETQIWRGTMGNVDMEGSTSNSSYSMYGMMDSSGDSQTSSTTYPFYVELESSDGLMLGQHVYIEMDEGQEDEKSGLWLSEYFIADLDTSNPFVWVANEDDRLEKRMVILGQYDGDLEKYEIVDGLSEDDRIAYPTEQLEEGTKAVEGDATKNIEYKNVDDSYDASYDTDSYDYDFYSEDMEFGDEEIIEDFGGEGIEEFDYGDDYGGEIIEMEDFSENGMGQDGGMLLEDMPDMGSDGGELLG